MIMLNELVNEENIRVAQQVKELVYVRLIEQMNGW